MLARYNPSFSRRVARKLRSMADHTPEIADDLRDVAIDLEAKTEGVSRPAPRRRSRHAGGKWAGTGAGHFFDLKLRAADDEIRVPRAAFRTAHPARPSQHSRCRAVLFHQFRCGWLKPVQASPAPHDQSDLAGIGLAEGQERHLTSSSAPLCQHMAWLAGRPRRRERLRPRCRRVQFLDRSSRVRGATGQRAVSTSARSSATSSASSYSVRSGRGINRI